MGMAIDKSTVRHLDLNRYMGKWYEIARFDHRFERNMEWVTADYTLLPDGKIAVENRGWRKGKWHTAKGKAKLPDPEEPGKLKVAFFLSLYSDYYVLELDEIDYTYAMIGSCSDKYLWILSRTPKIPADTLTMLLTKACTRGYDTNKILFVKQ